MHCIKGIHKNKLPYLWAIKLKQLIAISLFCMLLTQILYTGVSSIAMICLKSNRAERLAKNIQTIHISTESSQTNVVLMDGGKEVMYDNEMYDVVSVEKTGNSSYILKVKKDNSETTLSQQQKEQSKKIAKKINTQCYVITPTIQLSVWQGSYQIHKPIARHEAAQDPLLTNVIPPPRVV